MTSPFIQLLQCRKNMIKLLDAGHNLHQIPTGFKNNLFWNAAHCLVTQQLLCYKLNNVELLIPIDWVEAYKKGTAVPSENPIEIDILKDKLIELAEVFYQDFSAGKFKGLKEEYPTSFGISLLTFEDTLHYNNMHETLHLGYMMAMIKQLS